MPFSKRRLRWSAITLLVVCLLLLLRPTRAWLDRWLVAHVLGPGVSVSELVLHSSHSIVEARDVSWSGTRAGRSFQLTARRGWLAYDQLGLIDRHARLPKAIFQDADLRLDQAPPAPIPQLQQWKQRLAKQITQLDWERIQRQFSCLTATQELKKSWSDSIERWVVRSQQILAEAEVLEQQSTTMENPLRFDVSMAEKLQRLQELSSEQSEISKQFDALAGQLETETPRLQELRRQDHLKLTGLVIGTTATSDRQLERDRLCSELAQNLGQVFWQRIAPYGEIVDQLASATQVASRPSYDVNIRSDRHGDELFELREWKASGIFSFGDSHQSHYQAAGNWTLTQPALLRNELCMNWQASFQREHDHVEVHAEYVASQSDALKLLLVQTAMPSDIREPATPTLEPWQASSLSQGSQAKVTSQAGVLQGELVLHSDSLHWLAQESNVQSPKLAVQPNAVPLKFQMEGEWTQAKLELSGLVPAWLSQPVIAELETSIQAATQGSRRQLDQQFDSDLAELRQVVSVALAEDRKCCVLADEQLLATRQRLQQRQAEMNGTEFARRPGAITR